MERRHVAALCVHASRVRNHLTRAASWTSKDFGYRHLSALAKHAAAVVAADGSCCKFVCWQTVRALVALQQPRRQQGWGMQTCNFERRPLCS
eukprot:scaffold111889_cov18-Tisochrysis_lutea.AAC.1